MKRKQELPFPLELVREFGNAYPNCWNDIEHLRQQKGKDLPDWNNLCYCPLAGTQAILEKYGDKDPNNASLLLALASWRQYKEIYSFSDELKETLFAQNEDIVIPTDVLYQMPFPCIYISFNENEGFFVFFEQDMHTSQMELRFCEVSKTKSMFNSWIHIGDNFTIYDGIAEGIDIAIKNQKKYNLPYIIPEEDAKLYYFDKVSKLFQLVLYICADNAEIEENPNQKQITHRSKQPKDVYREIRSWDVGVKFAHKIRKINAITNNNDENKTEDETLTSTSNKQRSHRPHTRRGHWHHYWVGSQSNNSRKLILKWTAPMFVGGDTDDTITTIHKL